MSYTKTNWQTGDVITAEKLNKIENGVEAASNSGSGSGDFVKITAEYEDEQLTLDKTFSEIAEIIEGGGVPFVHDGSRVYMLTEYDTSSGVAKFDTAISYGSGTTAYVDEIYVNGNGATSMLMSLTVSIVPSGD